MNSSSNLAKQQLIVVAQAGDYLRDKSDNYKAQYRAVVDHLCKLIKESHKLDLTTKEVNNRDQFDITVSNLRENKIDTNRPFAFLFIAPEQKGRYANEELENTIKEISHVTKGERGDQETLSSSIIFVNDEDQNQSPKFTNHRDLLKSLACDNAAKSLLQRIRDVWQEFTHYSLKELKSDTLFEQINDYSKTMIESIMQSASSIKPNIPKPKPIKKSPARKTTDLKNLLTINDLKPEQRDKIKAIDWQKAQATSADTNRKSKYPVMRLLVEGKSYGEIANELNKTISTISKTINDFLKFTPDFMRGVDLATVTITKQ